MTGRGYEMGQHDGDDKNEITVTSVPERQRWRENDTHTEIDRKE